MVIQAVPIVLTSAWNLNGSVEVWKKRTKIKGADSLSKIIPLPSSCWCTVFSLVKVVTVLVCITFTVMFRIKVQLIRCVVQSVHKFVSAFTYVSREYIKLCHASLVLKNKYGSI